MTTGPFLVYTSNVFAILGLRSFYFLLSGVIDTLEYLKLGLAAVLTFVGFKMLLADIFHIQPLISLAIIAVLLGTAIGASIWKRRRDAPAARRWASPPSLTRPKPARRRKPSG